MSEQPSAGDILEALIDALQDSGCVSRTEAQTLAIKIIGTIGARVYDLEQEVERLRWLLDEHRISKVLMLQFGFDQIDAEGMAQVIATRGPDE